MEFREGAVRVEGYTDGPWEDAADRGGRVHTIRLYSKRVLPSEAHVTLFILPREGEGEGGK